MLSIKDAKRILYSDIYEPVLDDKRFNHFILLSYNSDDHDQISFTGIVLNSRDELINKEDFKSYKNNELHITIYSFNEFINMLLNKEQAAIDLLNEDISQHIIATSIGQELIHLKKYFISDKDNYSFIKRYIDYVNEMILENEI